MYAIQNTRTVRSVDNQQYPKYWHSFGERIEEVHVHERLFCENPKPSENDWCYWLS